MVQSLLLLILAAAAILGSPGPAPLSLAATGATFGWSRGVPYLLGLVAAIGLGCVAVAFGLGTVLSRGGVITYVLLTFSVGYFGYVAWKIASAPIALSSQAKDQAPGFRDGLILNLTNPKAYAAIVAVYAGFPLPFSEAWLSLVATGLAILLVALVVDAVWLGAGTLLTTLFQNPAFARPLRIAFAFAMVIAVMLSIAATFR